MNRDYIKDHVTIMIQKWTPLDTEKIIDMIYDDFESKTCENCRWYKTVAIVTEEQKLCALLDLNMGKNFGCNKFERKMK